jgi:hypothetical protein
MLKNASTSYNLHLFGFMDDRQNLNLQFTIGRKLNDFSMQNTGKLYFLKSKIPMKKLFDGISFKNEGILKGIKYEEAGKRGTSVTQLFDKAFEYYTDSIPFLFRRNYFSHWGCSH